MTAEVCKEGGMGGQKGIRALPGGRCGMQATGRSEEWNPCLGTSIRWTWSVSCTRPACHMVSNKRATVNPEDRAIKAQLVEMRPCGRAKRWDFNYKR